MQWDIQASVEEVDERLPTFTLPLSNTLHTAKLLVLFVYTAPIT